MLTSLLLAGILMQTLQKTTPVPLLQSRSAPSDWAPNANPNAPEWKGVKAVTATRGFFGETVALAPTEIRSRWTVDSLYLLYVCPYKTLYLKEKPVTNVETNQLWDWDVAEAFIGSNFEYIGLYKEFQVSPQGEFVDLDINREDPKAAQGVAWQSGFTVKARVDEKKKIWYGEMRIPFASLGVTNPQPGMELRIGLYRIEGAEPNRVYVAWSPTGKKTFHEPSAFGRLVLR